MIVYTPGLPRQDKFAIYVPPKNSGSTVRKMISYCNRSWRRRTGTKGPIAWNRSLYREFEGARRIGFVRCPVDRFQSLYSTRHSKLEKWSGQKIESPKDVLRHQFFHHHVWSAIPRMLECWSYRNNRTNWEQQDIGRHFIPQSFYLGTLCNTDRSGEKTGEENIDLFRHDQVNEVLKPFLDELFSTDIPAIKKNARGENRTVPCVLDDNDVAMIHEIYQADLPLWDSVK